MNLDERVLLRAPTVRDAALTCELLAGAGIQTLACRSLGELSLELERGAGALLLTEDVEASDSLPLLLAAIGRQPQWSEVPIVLLAHPTRAEPSLRRLAGLPGVTLLERPVRSRTLVSALQSALRARRRQYQLKAQLEAMHDLQARLAEELSGMHRLHLVGTRLLQAAPLEPLLLDVLHAALDLTGATQGAVELASPDGRETVVAAQVGFGGPLRGGEPASEATPPLGAAVLGLRATLRVALEEAAGEPAPPLPSSALRALQAAGVRMLQCAPLLGTAGRPLGAICVYWRTRARDSETRRVLFDLLARQASELLERDQAEQERRAADRRKDEFLATLAHELRNPLAPIRQAARVARAAAATPEQQRWSTEIIERQVNHMALLLDDLLDVSRITRGTLVLRRERVALAEAIAAAVETSRPAIDARAHALQVEMPATPVWVDADPLRLAQVLGNLLNNAAKYTDRGGHIRLWTSRPAAGAISIHVRDDGIGLDAASLSRVFEMFSQVTSSIERSEGGLGIGLALVRGLVEMHGGRVEARSDGPGCGSEFVVHLPVPGAAQPASEPEPESLPEAPAAPRRILVADDNVDAAESLALLLRLDGHCVDVVHDGEQAVAAVVRGGHDVALLDIGMPRLNGYETAQRIRAGSRDAPMLLVAVTGWGQREDRKLAAAAGFDHHLTKPVDFERLRRLVSAPAPPIPPLSRGPALSAVS
ncbi:MAG: ATP-binding protein [Steroidobacteraceae bacterium]|nr:ATP-binding protein [Steroidobacteraceae bacterium]